MTKPLLLMALLSSTALADQLYFARLETQVSWKEKKQTRHETRVYYSQILTTEVGDLRLIPNLDKYFSDGIVKPAAQRGVEIKYYDSDIKIYPASYSYENEAEAKAQLQTLQEADRSNHYAIYHFNWVYNGSANGEETSKPQKQ
jgi:hypothetical protein